MLDGYDGQEVTGLLPAHMDFHIITNDYGKLVYFWILFMYKGQMYKMLNAYLKRIALLTTQTDDYIRNREICFSAAYALLTIGGKLAEQQIGLILNCLFVTEWNNEENWERLSTFINSREDFSLRYDEHLTKQLQRLKPEDIDVIFTGIEKFSFVRFIGIEMLHQIKNLSYEVALRLFRFIQTLNIKYQILYWPLVVDKLCSAQALIPIEMFQELIQLFSEDTFDFDGIMHTPAIEVARTLICKQDYSAYRCNEMVTHFWNFIVHYQNVYFRGLVFLK